MTAEMTPKAPAKKATARKSTPAAADVRAAVEEIRAEIGAADVKAATLLTLAGAAAALTAAGPLIAAEGTAGVLTRSGAVTLVMAVVALLLVIRPRLTGAPMMTAGDPDWKPESPRERHTALAGIARRKHLTIRFAVDMMVGAVLLIAGGMAWAGVA
jgi:hypothetical protein